MARSGTQFLAMHEYKKNPDSAVENELDLNEGDTVVYLMTHEENEHWWLVEDGKGQVGYVPVAYLMIIIDETLHEEDLATQTGMKDTKRGLMEPRFEGRWDTMEKEERHIQRQ